jgi:hypothetical protein
MTDSVRRRTTRSVVIVIAAALYGGVLVGASRANTSDTASAAIHRKYASQAQPFTAAKKPPGSVSTIEADPTMAATAIRAPAQPSNRGNTPVRKTTARRTTRSLLGGDLYSTIVLHNAFAVRGVIQALGESGHLERYATPQLPLIATAIAAVVVLVIVDLRLIRPVVRARPPEAIA